MNGSNLILDDLRMADTKNITNNKKWRW